MYRTSNLLVPLLAGIFLWAACAREAPSLSSPVMLPGLSTMSGLGFKAKHTSAAQFTLSSGDVVASSGATWDGTTLALSDPALAYAIFAVDSPGGYTMLHLGCSDNGSTAWVAVSDFDEGQWRWIGHLEPEVDGVRVRAGNLADGAGTIYFAVVCAGGEGLSSDLVLGSTTARLLPPEDWPAKLTLPAELDEAYAAMLAYYAGGGDGLFWTEQTDLAGRRAACYHSMQNTNCVREEVIVGALVGVDRQAEAAFADFALQSDASLYVIDLSRQIAVFNFHRPLTKSERAFYGEQALLKHSELMQWAEPDGVGGPPP